MIHTIRRVILAFAIALPALLLPITVHADGGAPNLAYVAGTDHGISVIDIGQQKITRTINSGSTPHTVLLSLDGSFLYVTEPQQGQLAVLAANNGNEICHADIPGQPSLLTIDSGSNTLFTAGNGASSVSAIDPTNCKIKHTFQTDGPVYGIAIAAVGSSLSGDTGNQLWVSAGNSLTTFDDVTGKVIGSITIPGGPRYITIPPGATIYVTTQNGTVQAVDLTTRKVSQLVTGGQYGPMDFNENTGEVFVPDQAHNQLVVITPVNAGFALPHEPGRVIKTSSQPASIAITSDGQFGFVALAGGGVAMLDIPGRALVNTFHVGGNPQFIITGLYPPAVPQNSPQSNLLNIGAYVLVIGLIIVPLLLFRRYARTRSKTEMESKGDSHSP
ncbi:MAG: YncE family protein [Ktedonobacteraceae bacterium]|nr:YncE family protein [Ktedonobacteraceae bacterium]